MIYLIRDCLRLYPSCHKAIKPTPFPTHLTIQSHRPKPQNVLQHKPRVEGSSIKDPAHFTKFIPKILDSMISSDGVAYFTWDYDYHSISKKMVITQETLFARAWIKKKFKNIFLLSEFRTFTFLSVWIVARLALLTNPSFQL